MRKRSKSIPPVDWSIKKLVPFEFSASGFYCVVQDGIWFLRLKCGQKAWVKNSEQASKFQLTESMEFANCCLVETGGRSNVMIMALP